MAKISLTEQVKQLTIQRDNALNIANYFGANLATIEERIQKASFKGNLEKPFWFILKNYKELVAIVQFILETIKEVRKKIEDLNKNESPQQSN